MAFLCETIQHGRYFWHALEVQHITFRCRVDVTMMMGGFIRSARSGRGGLRVTGTTLMNRIPGEPKATLAPQRVLINISVTIKIRMCFVNHAVSVCVIVPTSAKYNTENEIHSIFLQAPP